MAEISILKEIYLFKDFSEAELNKVSEISNTQDLETDTNVFQQNAAAEALYIIKSGMVRIHQKGPAGENIEVAVLGEGSHFGEMALVDGQKRSATATVIEPSEIIVINYADIESIVAEEPRVAIKIYRSIAHFLCGRLRITTNDLSYAREQNLRFF